MSSTHARWVSGLLLLAWPFAMGCTVSANGTTGANDSQCRIDTAVLCPGDFVGYSCQGQTKPSPNCGAATLEEDGELGYCCAVRSTGTCVADTTAECSDGSTGYSCTDGFQPTAIDPSFVCSAGVSGPNADERYCCVSSASGSCAVDASIVGCASGSNGFACTGTDTPEQTRTSLVCSSATAGLESELLYCCSVTSG